MLIAGGLSVLAGTFYNVLAIGDAPSLDPLVQSGLPTRRARHVRIQAVRRLAALEAPRMPMRRAPGLRRRAGRRRGSADHRDECDRGAARGPPLPFPAADPPRTSPPLSWHEESSR
ncbi:hypothetical protein GCM10022206_21360 [Streptomyces chiangmaiensis]